MEWNPYWCMAVVTGRCPSCGKEMESQRKVKRHAKPGFADEDPSTFGYMGTCGCGRAVGGMVRWPFLMVFDEEEFDENGVVKLEFGEILDEEEL